VGVLALAALPLFFANGAEEHRQGDFLFELRTEDLFGHRGTTVRAFDDSDGRRQEIGLVEHYLIPKEKPRLMVFDTCEASQPCTLWYYDSGEHRKHLIASDQDMYPSNAQDQSRWAPNGCCFVMTGQYHAVLVNLEAAMSYDLQGPLRIGRPVKPVNGRFRQVFFKNWTDEGKAATLSVMSPVGDDDWDIETYSVSNQGEAQLMSTAPR
jgi:hypothetical protein